MLSFCGMIGVKFTVTIYAKSLYHQWRERLRCCKKKKLEVTAIAVAVSPFSRIWFMPVPSLYPFSLSSATVRPSALQNRDTGLTCYLQPWPAHNFSVSARHYFLIIESFPTSVNRAMSGRVKILQLQSGQNCQVFVRPRVHSCVSSLLISIDFE
jgi:hypothetical protein